MRFTDEVGNQLKQSKTKYLFVTDELVNTAKEAVKRCRENIVSNKLHSQEVSITISNQCRRGHFVLNSCFVSSQTDQ